MSGPRRLLALGLAAALLAAAGCAGEPIRGRTTSTATQRWVVSLEVVPDPLDRALRCRALEVSAGAFGADACAVWYGARCHLVVPAPRSWADTSALSAWGHELAHCVFDAVHEGDRNGW